LITVLVAALQYLPDCSTKKYSIAEVRPVLRRDANTVVSPFFYGKIILRVVELLGVVLVLSTFFDSLLSYKI
jgi:hypothetical protein